MLAGCLDYVGLRGLGFREQDFVFRAHGLPQDVRGLPVSVQGFGGLGGLGASATSSPVVSCGMVEHCFP